VAAQQGQALGGAGAEGDRAVQLGQAAAGLHLVVGLVAAQQRHVDAAGAGQVDQGAQVLVVVAVGAVLVLDLHGDHGAAAGDLPRGDDRQQGVVVRADGGEVAGLVPPHADLGVREQPAGQAAAVPLGADEGAGAHDRVHALGGDQVEEPAQVALPVGVEPAGLRGVEVPRHVGLDGVEPHQPGLADPVRPLLGVHAEVVQGAGDHLVRTSVQQEVAVTDLERRHGGCSLLVPRGGADQGWIWWFWATGRAGGGGSLPRRRDHRSARHLVVKPCSLP
jgi:hypothetical protein